MAVLVGGTEAFPGDDNTLVGTEAPDVIFGDAHTAGATPFFPDVPPIGGALVSGLGGDDRLEGLGEVDFLFGDAYRLAGTGVGGADRLLGGDGGDIIDGDADSMGAGAHGGADRLVG